MKLSLSIGDKLSSAEGIWVEYDTDVSFKIRYASPEIIRGIRKGHIKKSWRNSERVEIVNEVASDEHLWDKMIEDWKGITEGIGEGEVPAPCNKANKLKLIAISAEHGNFILENARDLSNFSNIQQEDKELKNL